MTKKRPPQPVRARRRVDCPVCGKSSAVHVKNGLIALHNHRVTDLLCPASNTAPPDGCRQHRGRRVWCDNCGLHREKHL